MSLPIHLLERPCALVRTVHSRLRGDVMEHQYGLGEFQMVSITAQRFARCFERVHHVQQSCTAACPRCHVRAC
jgi:hypothetical protein